MLQLDTRKKTYRHGKYVVEIHNVTNQRDSKSECCFGRYMPNSIKSQTRTKRGEFESQLSCHIQSDMKIPEWKRALTNGKFKRNLTKFYTMFLAEIARIVI